MPAAQRSPTCCWKASTNITACSADARKPNPRFEQGDWLAVQGAARDRIQYYDDRVLECVARLQSEFTAETLDESIWPTVKLMYVGLLMETDHKAAGMCRDFLQLGVLQDSAPRVLRQRLHFRTADDLDRTSIPIRRLIAAITRIVAGCATIKQIITDFGWDIPFENLDRDIGYVVKAIKSHLGDWPQAGRITRSRLYSPFYRNKAAT